MKVFGGAGVFFKNPPRRSPVLRLPRSEVFEKNIGKRRDDERLFGMYNYGASRKGGNGYGKRKN